MENTEKSKNSNGNAENLENRLHYSEEGEIWEIPNTPYNIKRQGEKWALCAGKWRIGEERDTRAQARLDAEILDASRVMQLIEVWFKTIKENPYLINDEEIEKINVNEQQEL